MLSASMRETDKEGFSSPGRALAAPGQDRGKSRWPFATFRTTSFQRGTPSRWSPEPDVPGGTNFQL